MTNKLIKILLISHDELAKGMLSTVKFFDKEVDNITAIAAYSESDNSNVHELIVQWLNENSEFDRLIITDIVGGSVNQTAFKLLKDYRFYLISGMCLPLLLEIMFLRNIDYDSLEEIVKNTRDQILLMNNVLIRMEEDEF